MKADIAKEPDGNTNEGSLLFEHAYENTVFATINGNVVANICRQIDGFWYFYGEDDVLLAASDLREVADVVDGLNAEVMLNVQPSVLTIRKHCLVRPL